MADISGLSGLQPVEPLNLDIYKEASSGFTMPPAGIYPLRAPDSFPATAFRATQKGALSAQIDPTIASGPFEGTVVRFQRVSASTFERGGTKVSFMGDYLKANGLRGEVPGDPQVLANLVESTAGRTYQAELDWEARHQASGFQVKGMRNFPKDSEGKYQPWIQHPTEKDADGNPLRLRANLVIRRFISA